MSPHGSAPRASPEDQAHRKGLLTGLIIGLIGGGIVGGIAGVMIEQSGRGESPGGSPRSITPTSVPGDREAARPGEPAR